MNLRVTIDGRPAELELRCNGESCSFRLLSGRGETVEKAAWLREVEPSIFLVLLGGRSYEARIEPGDGHAIVSLRGRRFAVEVEDPRRLKRRSSSVLGEGVLSIAAPMPGKVVRVLAAEGDEVQAGQGLVVVEAMKMQNEMKAPKAGRVKMLAARPGASVAAGEVLATIE